MVAKIKKAHFTLARAEMCFWFYYCLLKIIANTIIKVTAKIVNAINALKSMYIIAIKLSSIISTTFNLHVGGNHISASPIFFFSNYIL